MLTAKCLLPVSTVVTSDPGSLSHTLMEKGRTGGLLVVGIDEATAVKDPYKGW